MSKKDLYRPNVAMILMSHEYPQKKELFIAQRNDMVDIWQFPQGGIDEGEEIKEALFRELEEEVGTNEVTIVCEYPEWISYDFPENVAKKMQPYKGQKQKYFLLKFDEKAKIALDTTHPEFSDYKFVSIDEVLKHTAHFKKPVYEQVISYFKKEGYL